MLNSCVFMGRLTADPEIRHTNSGTPVTSVTIACDRDYTRQGEDRQTDFIDVTVWGRTAEFACNFFRKGMLVAVEGRLESSKWVDKAGQSRVSYFINADHLHFAERKQDGTQSGQQNHAPAPGYAPYRKPDIAGPIFDAIEAADDDTPF